MNEKILILVDRQTFPNWEPPNGWVRPDEINRAHYKRLGAWRKLGYDLKRGQQAALWALSWNDHSYVAYFHISQMVKVAGQSRIVGGQAMSESVE